MLINRINYSGNQNEFNLSLIMTQACNIDCIYCFEHNKRYESMGFETAVSAINTYLDMNNGATHLNVDFTGGEPLLEFDCIKRIVEHFVRKATLKKKIRFSIGTNATLLDEEKKAWLLKHRCVQITFSLDGTKEVHDYNRSGSYDLVVKHVDFFKGYDPTIKMTISRFTIPRLAESVIHIHGLGLRPEANVVYEDIWGTKEEKRHLLGIYAEQLDLLVEYYTENPSMPVPRLVGLPISFFVDAEPQVLTRKYCGSGSSMATVTPDGSVYPCHRFAPVSTDKPLPLIDVKKPLIGPAACLDCKLFSLCPSCLGANHDLTGSIDIRANNHCEFFKLEVLASAKLASNFLRKKHNEIEAMSQRGLSDEELISLGQLKRYAEAIVWVQENVQVG